MIELLLILFLIIIFLLWAASRKKNPETVIEEQWDKEKEYLEKISELKEGHIQKIEQVKYQAREKLHEQEIEHRDSIKAIRKDSVNKSRSSLSGKIWEQVCSMIPGFKYNPADMRFLGSPVDYIIFKGMHKKDIEKVIFLEIKTGDSTLTEQQEKIKRAVKAGRVEWREYRINK